MNERAVDQQSRSTKPRTNHTTTVSARQTSLSVCCPDHVPSGSFVWTHHINGHSRSIIPCCAPGGGRLSILAPSIRVGPCGVACEKVGCDSVTTLESERPQLVWVRDLGSERTCPVRDPLYGHPKLHSM